MENDFEKFRHSNPYKVPDGFFENISKQTLEKAHQRERFNKVRKMRIIFSAAASAIVLIAVGYLFINQNEKETATIPVQAVTEERISEEIHPEKILSADSGELTQNDNIETKQPEKIPGNAPDDLLDNLIAGLSDEDLLQLETAINEELLISELLND